MNYDVVVIGAGPIGTVTAETIARKGYAVVILEEHSEVGLPSHCTGKLTVNAFKELNLSTIGVIHKIKGAIFYSPNMKSLKIKREKPQAYILNRQIFDRWLADKALEAGVTLLTGAKARDIQITSTGVNVTFKYNNVHNCMQSRVVIGADGAHSSIAKRIGIYSKDVTNIRIGVQNEITGIQDLEPNFVQLFFGKKYADGFFAWIVPVGKESARVGLGLNPYSGKAALKQFNNFVKNHPVASKQLEGCSYGKSIVHVIPTGGTLQRTVDDGVLIVGDAAGQVKSTTGGGLYYGILCAQIAGNTISKALELSKEPVLRKEALYEYEQLWRGKLEKELIFTWRARSFLDSLTDNELNYLFRSLTVSESLPRIIEAKGDIDWQSKLMLIAFKPFLTTLMNKPKIFYKFARSFLSYRY